MRHSAKRFFSKTLAAPHTSTPRVITVDKNAAYPKAFKQLKADGIIPDSCELRQSKYPNNLVGAATIARIKRLVKLGMGFFSCEPAWRSDAADMRTMNMVRKGQIRGVEKRDSIKQVVFIASLFEVAS